MSTMRFQILQKEGKIDQAIMHPIGRENPILGLGQQPILLVGLYGPGIIQILKNIFWMSRLAFLLLKIEKHSPLTSR